MEQIYHLEDLGGENLIINKAFYHVDKIFLSFKESFCIIKINEYESDYLEIESDEFNQVPDAYNCDILLKLGIISEAESIKIISKYQKENDELKKRNDLIKLAELKAQYPDEKSN